MSAHPFDRRQFIASMAGGVAGLAATACAPTVQRTDINTVAGGDTPGEHAVQSVQPTHWDDSWTGRLGRHRTVFDVSELEQAPGAAVIPDVMDAWHEALGTTDRDLGMVLVLRHRAVPLFFSDALWATYDISHDMKEQDPLTKAAYRRNPQRELVASLQQRGVTVLGCNRAVLGFTNRMADQRKSKVEDVRREVMDGLMPGVILLPNGLYALARAQDVGCGFMR